MKSKKKNKKKNKGDGDAAGAGEGPFAARYSVLDLRSSLLAHIMVSR